MYKSIRNTVVSEIEIDKSVFICTLVPVNSSDNALKNLEELRNKYSDATHNCYAYVLNNGQVQKCSDDGEPSKTAGYPILQAIMNNNLNNVLCVVTRYFGGVKLGAGGLIRAYNNSAMSAINIAEVVSYYKSKQFEVTFDFNYINNIEILTSKIKCEVIDKQYLDKVTYTINLRTDLYDEFNNNCINITKGQVIISNITESFITE